MHYSTPVAPFYPLASAKALCSAAILLAALQPAWAQTASPSAPDGTTPDAATTTAANAQANPVPPAASAKLDGITVTAGKLAQKRFDAPAAISTSDGATIRASGPQVNLSDALAGMPGVVALNRNNYAQDIQISIRGYGARSPFGLQSIRLIADDVPATIPDGEGQSSTVSLTSADRIEVLRGPLAQMYGNASGGVIQTWTREAGPQPEVQTQLYTGSYGLKREDLEVSGRTDNNKVGIVADLSNFDIGGWRANSGAKREQFNSVITIDPQEGTRFRLVANKFNMPYADDALGLTAAQLAKNPQQAGTNGVLDQTRKSVMQDQVGLVMDQRLPGAVTFQGRVYYGTRENTQFQASSVTTAPGNQSGTWVGLNRVYDGVGLQFKGAQRDWAVPMEWTAGFDADRSSEHRQGGATLLGTQVGSLTRDEQNIATNADLFVQTNWQLGERWSAVAGLRSSNVTLSNVDYDLAAGNDSGSASYHALTPVVGVTWHVTDDLNLYANLGRGFETPTLTDVAYVASGSSVVARFNPTIQAATSVNFEMGAKWQPSRKTNLEAALFQINTSNEIISALSVSGKTAYANAPGTVRQGLELAYNSALGQHISTRWGGTLMNAKYNAAFTSAGALVASGNSLPAIPQQQVLGQLSWTQEAHSDGKATKLRGAEATIEWSARSRLWANDLNTAAAGGYGIVNLRVRDGMEFGPVHVDAFVGLNNVANRAYVGSVIINQVAGGYFEPGLPRNWVLGLNAVVPF